MSKNVLGETIRAIRLTVNEIQSGSDRVKWAEGLIRQLPENHDGRNSWLMNYGKESEDRQRLYPEDLSPGEPYFYNTRAPMTYDVPMPCTSDMPVIKEGDVEAMAKFRDTLISFRKNQIKDNSPVSEEVHDHPLFGVMIEAIQQAMYGKGERHGGNVTPFMDQPWVHYAKMHGRGFLTGQSAKKLEEASSKRTGDAFRTEVLGAIVYAGMAILHELEESSNVQVKQG